MFSSRCGAISERLRRAGRRRGLYEASTAIRRSISTERGANAPGSHAGLVVSDISLAGSIQTDAGRPTRGREGTTYKDISTLLDFQKENIEISLHAPIN